jgi:sugar phosphate isomerase/epimerase
MNRRSFLRTVLSGSLFSGYWEHAFAEQKIDRIGVQLYTIRDAMQQDFEGSLARVARIGYREVELAGFSQTSQGAVAFWSKTPQEIRSILHRHELSSPAAHVSFECLDSNLFPKVVDAAYAIGNRYIVMPWIDERYRRQADFWKQAADIFNCSGEICKKAGMQFAYHNHWFEFLPVNAKLPYDILLESCDPDLVKMQLDICWICVTGNDPIQYFNRYPKRFPLLHVKDIKKYPKVTAGGFQNFGDSLSDMTEVGSGIIDWKNIFSHAGKAGAKYFIVEHDKPAKPFESITGSYAYLEKLRF